MELRPCPACGGALASKELHGTPVHVCSACGGAFFEPAAYGRLVSGGAFSFSPAPASAKPSSPWGVRNLLLHLGALVLTYAWMGSVTAAVADQGEGFEALIINGFLCYAGVTTILALVSRNIRLSSLVVHAPALVWMLSVGVSPALLGVRTWYAQATRPAPLEVPGMLVLSEWKVYRAGPSNASAALTVRQSFEGRIVIESLEALRGDAVVGQMPPSLLPNLFRGATVTTVPFAIASADAPRRFRLSLLVYPTRRERSCRTGEDGEPLGETPIQRLVLDTDARGVEKLGTRPHECGPLDTVSYQLMEPAAYPD